MIKIKLKSPIDFGDEHISEFILQKPAGKDMRQVPLNIEDKTWGDMYPLVSRLSGHPEAVLDRLEVADLRTIIERVGFLLQG